MATLTWHGHSTFTLETAGGVRIVIDPWFEGNPAADRGLGDVGPVDWIFCTHGHADHFADALPLARATGATLVSSFEIVGFCQEQGLEKVHGLGVGGGYTFPFGRVQMTPALHGGQVHGDESGRWTCTPGGFLFHVDGLRILHAGDTALTLDMTLLEGRVDVAILPIGDNYTMGPGEAARAVGFIRPEVVIPMHYDTFELLRQDPEAFREQVRAEVGDETRVEVLRPGQGLDLGIR
jgi:L-ascorbate metabolism protein UlaG (beta-lactamase superfamily)